MQRRLCLPQNYFRDRNNPEVSIRHACFTQRHTGINVSPTNVCVECIGSFVMRRIAKSLGKSTRCRSAIVPVGEGPGFNICVSKFGGKYRIRFCLFVNEYLSDNLFKRLNIKSMPCNEYNAKVWRWRAGICSLSIGPQLNPMVAVVQNNLPEANASSASSTVMKPLSIIPCLSCRTVVQKVP